MLKKRQRTLTRLMIIMTSLVVVSLLVTSFFVRESEKMKLFVKKYILQQN